MAEESFESLWLKIPAEMRDEWLFSGCGKGDAETSGGVEKKERKGKEVVEEEEEEKKGCCCCCCC